MGALIQGGDDDGAAIKDQLTTGKDQHSERPDLTNQQETRQDLIATAVRFLENSKIRSTSVELKTSFLKKKGLTDEEIATAFKQVETLEESKTVTSIPAHDQAAPAIPPGYLAPLLPPAIVQEYPVSKKVRDVLNIILLIGGFSYGITYLWRKYVLPWWYGVEKQTPEQILLQTSQTLLSTVMTLKEGMDKLQNSLDTVTSHGSRSENEVSDLKKEVMSLKGLLLSRRLRPRQTSSSSLIPRGAFVQSEPGTPFLAGLVSPGGQGIMSPGGQGIMSPGGQGIMSPGGQSDDQQSADLTSPEIIDLYEDNVSDKPLNLIEDIDD